MYVCKQSGDRDPALPESNKQGLSQEEMVCEHKGLKRQLNIDRRQKKNQSNAKPGSIQKE